LRTAFSVGGAGHDIAGAVALIVGMREAFEVREQIVAEVKFDVGEIPMNDPARQELEDALATKTAITASAYFVSFWVVTPAWRSLVAWRRTCGN